VTPLNPFKIGPFNLGVNNRLPDNHMEVPKVGTFLRSAVNVDLSDPGTVKRREGFTLSAPGGDCHSIYSAGDAAYVVDGTALYALSGPPSSLVKTPVRTGMAPGQRLSFTQVNGLTVYTDGASVRSLSGALDAALGVPMMNPEPRVVAAAGDLPSGRYQVCFTYFNDQFQQSGSTTPVAVSGTGIEITGLPAAFPDGVTGVMVYMTAVNGDLLQLAEVLSVPQAGLSITAPPELTVPCQTLLMRPMPGGSIVRHSDGRLLVASGSRLYFSEPFSNLHDPSKNFIPLDADITMVEPLSSGVFVATGQDTFHIAGDITQAPLRSVLPYGAVRGTSGSAPDKKRCWWMSPMGLVYGDESGGVRNVQQDAVAIGQAGLGASLFREQDGQKHVVTSLFGTEPTSAAAYSYMQAEIIRKETIL
jgi:hypothetical protein